MKPTKVIVAAGAALAFGALSVACRDEPVAPTQSPPALAAPQDVASVRLPDDVGGRVVAAHRTPLRGGIVHYTFDVALGPGQFDVIRLHRVVREHRPHEPIGTEDAIFLLPGNPNHFENIFMEPLITTAVPWDQSVAIYLAKNDVDVWGMDYAWALVPATTTDFSFMKDWGLAKEIQFAERALSAARSLRASTGQGNGKLDLLGFSYGVILGYAIAGDETQWPRARRNVKGFVPVDYYFKTNDDAVRASYCQDIANEQSLLDAGTYQDASGLFFQQLGSLAKSAPNDPSPFFGSLTNLQFLLYVAASDGGGGHFAGGTFDASGIPTGLRFTDPALWPDLAVAAPPYAAPVRGALDDDALVCGQPDVPFDDHLGEIRIPILYVGAAGGFGQGSGPYSTTLTASRDVTTLRVQLLPDDQRAFDYGHADLFTGSNAQRLVWRPILNWILAHRADHDELARQGR
jgi:hypothetical protein